MDRISHLPDFIVHHILSFLNTTHRPPKDLVRMSVLSKTWFRLTASFPILDFTLTFASEESFFKYVEYTASRFCHQNLTARRLTLITDVCEPAELDVVNRCLELLLNNGVEELVVEIGNFIDDTVSKFRLPDTLLSVSVLKSLRIFDCDLPFSLMVDVVKFKSLINLKLHSVFIENEVITHLATSCPLLQTFHVIKCNGFDGFCVYGHQNLGVVRIEYRTPVERIDIDAPNLSDLWISDLEERGAPQMNLSSCKKLTTVTYMVHSTNGFTDLLSNFPFVKKLRLVTLNETNNLKLSSCSLRILELDSTCDLENIELRTPDLDLFVYSFSNFFLSTPVPLTHLKTSMRCYLDCCTDTLWFQKLRLFLDKKNGFKALNLYIRATRKFKKLEKLKAIKLPPYELEHVELQLENHKETSGFVSFVDAVLWCCRPRSLMLISPLSLTEQSDLITFTYERLLQQEGQGQGQGHINIKIVLPHNGKTISFVKEVLQEADN